MGAEINFPVNSPGRTWFKPDMADLMDGALIESGASVSIVSPYAFSDNNVKATITCTGVDDGFREAYLARATVLKTLGLFANLNTTHAKVLTGATVFEQWMIPRSLVPPRSMVLAGLVNDNAFASANGVMAGYRGRFTVGEIAATTIDRTVKQDGAGDSSAFGDPIHCRIQRDGSALRAISQNIMVGLPVGWSEITGANSLADDLRIGLHLGNHSSTAIDLIADYDIWFAAVDMGYGDAPI